jgi:hypothetical protein
MAKFIDVVNGVLTRIAATVTSAGAANAGDIVALDASGRLDLTVMPVGIGADTQVVVASEALVANNLVNVYDNGGTPAVRKADNSNGRRANGFVLANVANGASATVYRDGTNTGITAPIGDVFLGVSGGVTATAPTATGTIIQPVGNIGPGGLSFETGVVIAQ